MIIRRQVFFGKNEFPQPLFQGVFHKLFSPWNSKFQICDESFREKFFGTVKKSNIDTFEIHKFNIKYKTFVRNLHCNLASYIFSFRLKSISVHLGA